MRHIYVNNMCISDVLDSIPTNSQEPITIHLAPGCYHEKLTIRIPFLTLLGDSPETTYLTYDDAAFDRMPDGSKRGTFRSFTLFIDTHDFTASNLTIENSAGNGDTVGQAVAVYADGDHIFFDHCHLLGYQDTLFTGPLPPTPYEPNGFIGPKEFAPRVNGHQYYRNCLIAGTIDYIFGSATAYFEHCTLYSRKRNTSNEVQGYVTAASTPEGQLYGYVFHQCHITGECPDATVYLGRPWRDFARSVFLDCTMDSLIHPDLFHDWGKDTARQQCFYAISSASGYLPSENSFFHLLTEKECLFYKKELVLDNWIPDSAQTN